MHSPLVLRSLVWGANASMQTVVHGVPWAAGYFSDTACLGFQAALVRSRNSCSTSLGVRYPRAE